VPRAITAPSSHALNRAPRTCEPRRIRHSPLRVVARPPGFVPSRSSVCTGKTARLDADETLITNRVRLDTDPGSSTRHAGFVSIPSELHVGMKRVGPWRRRGRSRYDARAPPWDPAISTYVPCTSSTTRTIDGPRTIFSLQMPILALTEVRADHWFHLRVVDRIFCGTCSSERHEGVRESMG
jgi:hypothetical protein